jgi:hypothetical protein
MTCVSLLNAESLGRLGTQHLANLAAVDGGGAERITDKMPGNYIYLGLLAAMFPKAVFIHCRRDLRDVALSCWMTGLKCLDWTNDIGHIRSHMAEYLRLMEHWRRVLPVTLHEVNYEHVVADLNGSVRRVLAACGLEWDPACLDFYRNRRVVHTASAAQVRTPIYSRSIGRWQHYQSELPELFAGLESQEPSTGI